MKVYRIKIDGTGSGYVRGVLISTEKGFETIVTHDKNDAAWYEEDKAKVYCEELNNQSIKENFKLEEVENNEEK